MNYRVYLPNKSLIVRGVNKLAVSNFIKSLPSFRELTLSERFKVRIEEASWDAPSYTKVI